MLFIYLAPFFVVLGARIVLPADRFRLPQWLGLSLSFAGMLVAFGVPTPALDPRQMLGDVMMVGAALFWAATTLTIKASALNRVPAEKVMLYQLVVSAPMLALAAWAFGERIAHAPSALAVGALAYQTFWVVSVTFVIWFALMARLFRQPSFRLHIPDAIIRRRRRPSGAGRAADLGFRRRGGAGRRRPGAGEPGALTVLYSLALRAGTPNEHICAGTSSYGSGRCRRRHGRRRLRPIVVQSMTNTDTADVEGTARQVAALARAGSELVRITVDRDEAAAAVPRIKERLAQFGVSVPLIGDFHYIGHKLLADHPGLRRGARQIPHQSRQCRLQQQARSAIFADHRDRAEIRQAGAHRRQLGLARSGTAHAADGRERQVGKSRATRAR